MNPVGFYNPNPSFSWKLPEGTVHQTAYRVELDSDHSTWDSGWIESSKSTYVPFGGVPLRSRERVRWRVNYRNERGISGGWSAYARFEMGLLTPEDWLGRWIRPSQNVDYRREPVAVLKREFNFDDHLEQARLYVTARGLFAVQINGQRVGRDHFANGFTSYRNRIDTLTYDVTSLLNNGTNCILAHLGTGWYAGRFPFETENIGPYGMVAAFLAQLEISRKDGAVVKVISDAHWKGSYNGPIVSSSLYDGEVFDARNSISDWAPVLVEEGLGQAVLAPKPNAPVREVGVLQPKSVRRIKPGCFIFDMGQNMVGWARIRIPVEAGKTVTIRFGEMLQRDGNLYTENYRTAKSCDQYTAAKSEIVQWEPHFTFHGFRYVELSGVAEDSEKDLSWVEGVVLGSDLAVTGRFVSSHELLNRLQSNITWSWRGNSLDVPTDCPQRDERMGWTGDAQVFCPTSMFNTDAHAFWKGWLRSLRDDQYEDGGVPPFAPTAESQWKTTSPGWADAATIIPWELYVRTGDIDVLSQNYGMMKGLVNWYRVQMNSSSLSNVEGFGDWLQPYSQCKPNAGDKLAICKGDTSLPLLGLAFYAKSSQITADTARLLGRAKEAEAFTSDAAKAKEFFIRNYLDDTGRLKNVAETQTSYVLAIVFDLLPPELRKNVAENLVRLIDLSEGHLRTGFLGTPYLAKALDLTGYSKKAAEIVFKESYPSWFFSINQGATTMWERWNGFTLAEGFGDATMNSFNHYAYGAVGQWMYERLAGLEPDPLIPGYRHFFVRPLFIDQLDSACAKLETPFGLASSGWTRTRDSVILKVTVPPNSSATIFYPYCQSPFRVKAGEYEIDGKANAGIGMY